MALLTTPACLSAAGSVQTVVTQLYALKMYIYNTVQYKIC